MPGAQDLESTYSQAPAGSVLSFLLLAMPTNTNKAVQPSLSVGWFLTFLYRPPVPSPWWPAGPISPVWSQFKFHASGCSYFTTQSCLTFCPMGFGDCSLCRHGGPAGPSVQRCLPINCNSPQHPHTHGRLPVNGWTNGWTDGWGRGCSSSAPSLETQLVDH